MQCVLSHIQFSEADLLLVYVLYLSIPLSSTTLRLNKNNCNIHVFQKYKHNWFVTPLAPQGKRTPGLFKIEFKGDKLIGLCSKSYCTELFATENSTGQVQFSMKGVNKGQFKIPC